ALHVDVDGETPVATGLGRRLDPVPARDLQLGGDALAPLVGALAVHPAQDLVELGLQPFQPGRAGQIVAGEADQVGGQVVAGHVAPLVVVDPDTGQFQGHDLV